MPRKLVSGPQVAARDPIGNECKRDSAALPPRGQVGGDRFCPSLPNGGTPRRILTSICSVSPLYPSIPEGEGGWYGDLDATAVSFDQEMRARELEELGYAGRGKRVRECGLDRLGVWWCGDRQCPRCSRKRARLSSEAFLEVARGWETSEFWTLTRPSEGPWRLKESLREMRTCLNAWRRRKCVKEGVLGAVGAIEPKCARAVWSVHAHLVVEVDRKSISHQELEAAWEEVTGGKGRFLVEEPIRSLERVTSYTVKMRDECPDPGSMELSRYAHLVKGVKGARLKIAWGTGYKS
jgi:hypothetical protein